MHNDSVLITRSFRTTICYMPPLPYSNADSAFKNIRFSRQHWFAVCLCNFIACQYPYLHNHTVFITQPSLFELNRVIPPPPSTSSRYLTTVVSESVCNQTDLREQCNTYSRSTSSRIASRIVVLCMGGLS